LIFVTVGSLLPFDRLIRRMDEIAASLPGEAFFAQIGDGAYKPRHIAFARSLSRRDFTAKVETAKAIVAHAGMGSVISAMEVGTPIVLLPRRLEAGEHNTDHQFATARWLQGRSGISVCFSEDELEATLLDIILRSRPASTLARVAPAEFVQRIRAAIADSPSGRR
jgi:UDP-N-acetylglucosamine transferase subunit ALG13